MTWQNAKSEAQAWAEIAGFSGDLSGKLLMLPTFRDDEDCAFFLPGRGLNFHSMVLKAAGRTARKAGAKVVPVIVQPKDYRAWLRVEKREDTASERAAYLRTITRTV